MNKKIIGIGLLSLAIGFYACKKEELQNPSKTSGDVTNSINNEKRSAGVEWRPTAGTELNVINGFFDELEEYENDNLISYNIAVDVALWKIEAAINYNYRINAETELRVHKGLFSTSETRTLQTGTGTGDEISSLEMYSMYQDFVTYNESAISGEEIILVTDIEIGDISATDITYSLAVAKADIVIHTVHPPSPTIVNGIVTFPTYYYQDDWYPVDGAGICSWGGGSIGKDATHFLSEKVTYAMILNYRTPSQCTPPIHLTRYKTNVKKLIGYWNNGVYSPGGANWAGLYPSGATLWQGLKTDCIDGVSTSGTNNLKSYTTGGQNAINNTGYVPANKDVFYVEYDWDILPSGGSILVYHHIIDDVIYGDINCGPAAN